MDGGQAAPGLAGDRTELGLQHVRRPLFRLPCNYQQMYVFGLFSYTVRTWPSGVLLAQVFPVNYNRHKHFDSSGFLVIQLKKLHLPSFAPDVGSSLNQYSFLSPVILS